MELRQELQSDIRSLVDNTMQILQYGIAVESRHSDQEFSDDFVRIEREIYICRFCNLYKSRIHSVLETRGSVSKLLIVTGISDEEGVSFDKSEEEYLDSWLDAIELSREKDTFIINIVKCTPQQQASVPSVDEVQSCGAYFRSQINILQPRVILALGKLAGNILTTDYEASIEIMRENRYDVMKIPLFVSYHPSMVMKNKKELRPLVWGDLQKIRSRIHLKDSEHPNSV